MQGPEVAKKAGKTRGESEGGNGGRGEGKEGNEERATLAMRRGRAVDWIWIPEGEEMMVEEMGVAVRGRV